LEKLYKEPGRNDIDSVVEKCKEMESHKIQEAHMSKMELQSAIKELEGLHRLLKKTTNVELTLRTIIETLNLNIKKKRSLMRHLMDDSKHPLSLHPSQFLYKCG
jgi:hypothetical protein